MFPQHISTSMSAPFWRAAASGTIMLQRCATCFWWQFYPGQVCRHCWSMELDWSPASGFGTVWTCTSIHLPAHPAWSELAPFLVAVVELDEGPRMVANLHGAGGSELVGRRVRVSAPLSDSPAPFAFVLSP